MSVNSCRTSFQTRARSKMRYSRVAERDQFQVERDEARVGLTSEATATASRISKLDSRVTGAGQLHNGKLLRIVQLEGELTEAHAAAYAVRQHEVQLVEVNNRQMSVVKASCTGGPLASDIVDRLAMLEVVQSEWLQQAARTQAIGIVEVGTLYQSQELASAAQHDALLNAGVSDVND